ncbi:tRNA (adenosine(37)-N6)-threonylcarbamoyltransferase complex dimerization subunit type 1 TsaB [Paucibacter sp. R3-3]|uniref:tRNA (Adenosine(37)-N6)-threonylcarbamoyltransferase complex dimerization subunit type 1 TsaB n=1 Tax=Roseateles agri TaxID=3098619 RepID=A0ABU5DBG2_9BURK|nr:tRNA (adenosine(37)-N6)-threonylcarbamoyltransferase complex dimerization subunit type 1 TsaB [Paucibacter sp. R3-3]MDY0743578.1 tRNA (adenosine(37)-N6)-threonylcarbamoyltransferase complex dimerization subunit type 1 TsaB [Paucibacter sp. R3-3]
MTVLLAFDSSTESMALALVTPSGERIAVDAEGGPQASARLVPEALALLERAGLTLADVDAIGFGRGPGAFTGLRTACAVAQGLAFGAGKPVLSLDSLMLVAEDARQQAAAAGEPSVDRIWVAMDARMGEIYAGAYRFDGERWITESEPALYAPAALLAQWGEPGAVAGSALVAFEGQLGLAGRAVRCWPATISRGGALAELTQQAWAAGALLDPADAMPIYVRDKVAQTTQERLEARSALSSS